MMNVLLAEDNIQNQKIFLKIAYRKGWNVDFASNGFQAVDLASENKYDCIMMDIEMPINDGFEAAEEIRKTDKTTPIVALTSLTDLNQTMLADSGMNGYLQKPYSPDRIYEVVEFLAR